MSEGGADRFWEELRALYDAAGKPTLDSLVRLGGDQLPKVSISTSTVHAWLNDINVPTGKRSERYFRVLVAFLQPKAEQAGYQRRPDSWWQGLLHAAQQDRTERRGGRPRSPRAPAQSTGVALARGPMRGTSFDQDGSISTSVKVHGGQRVRDAILDRHTLYDLLDLGRFVGRRWLVDRVDEFIHHEPCGYFVIEGDSGVGKTAFACWLAEHRGWPIHSCELEGGNRIDVLRNNLAAQLIQGTASRSDRDEQHGLADDRSVLPDNAGTPEWFFQELSAAAQVPGRTPVVLVIDGLDDVDSASGKPMRGLPKRLPHGVYAVITCRTGTNLTGLRGPSAAYALRAHDAANIADLRSYLELLLNEAAPDSPLDAVRESRESRDAFCTRILGRCGGLWIYLRCMLDEIYSGRRTVTDLDSLPADLWSYYRERLTVDGPGLPPWYLPTLTTFAALGQPVAAQRLAAIADVPQAAEEISKLLDGPLRSLLRVNRSEETATYEVGHASVRDFLAGARQPGAPDSDAAETLCNRLRQMTTAAHERIADRYLRAWGGLESGLELLRAGPELAGLDDGYGVRNLLRHLEHAGRDEDVHRLFGRSCGNVWRSVHERIGDVHGYLDALGRAQRLAQDQTDQSRAAGEQAGSIGLEVRYRLMVASEVPSAHFPAELLGALIENGVWTPARALAHIERATGERQRAEGLAAMADHLTPDLLNRSLRIVEDAIGTPALRAQTLAELASHLPGEEAARLAAWSLDEASRSLLPMDYVEAAARVAPLLPLDARVEVLRRALHSVSALTDPWAQAEALTALAPSLSPALVGEALELAGLIQRTDAAADAMLALAQYVTSATIEGVLVFARRLDPVARVELLSAAADHLPGKAARRMRNSAFREVTKAKDRNARIDALNALAPRLTDEQLRTAYARFTAAQDTDEALIGLSLIARHLPDDLLGSLVAEAGRIADPDHRAILLIAACAHPRAAEHRGLYQDANRSVARVRDGMRRFAWTCNWPPCCRRNTALAGSTSACGGR